MSTILVKVKEMFSFKQELSGDTASLIADSCQHLKKLSLIGGIQILGDDVVYVIKTNGKQLTTLCFNGNKVTDVVYLYLNHCAR